jgi:hypothetical protein
VYSLIRPLRTGLEYQQLGRPGRRGTYLRS